MLSSSPRQTQKIAEILVKTLLADPEKSPRIFCLQGDLGAGKTTFIQGIAKALKIKNKILSPTFVIMKDFKIGLRPFQRLFHIDCYRFDKPEEILALNFKEIITNPKNLIFIEWPERIAKFLPKNSVWLEFKVKGKNKREIIISSKRKMQSSKQQLKTKNF
ncbi:MAG TPA: tRNA (adenosine(37)-N6)-threonylcarbamoyltransferase complex ATPase subunit type 1 TsaE [Candidatus Paceibacterota bacterium]|nr:tRNA (adenosine(37)-N6)-threonylcarbamoyltransferase complex ATPase subunit type 1 TsaE [Candidatus Paceibacterota bacterium]HRY76693.1 tRNA (adenosine(37)-N6)-threonylcarbamoyltransferase complex ATPase subunit type 1 TsaE [Candidatus Paceibacterota bacterium]